MKILMMSVLIGVIAALPNVQRHLQAYELSRPLLRAQAGAYPSPRKRA